MAEPQMAVGKAEPAAPQAGAAPVEPAVHYSYLGLALLLYGVLAGWSIYHAQAMAAHLDIANRELPAFSRPLFWSVGKLGYLLFLPLGAMILGEVVMPRRLTRLWLFLTLALVPAGIYVAIALWLPAQRVA